MKVKILIMEIILKINILIIDSNNMINILKNNNKIIKIIIILITINQTNNKN